MRVLFDEKMSRLTRMIVVLLVASTIGLSGCGSSAKENMITLQISGVRDRELRDQIASRLPELVESASPSITSDWTGETMTVELSPVEDVEAFARRIDFGVARVVDSGTIVVEVSTAEPADLTAANTDLQTPAEPEAKPVADPTPPPPYDAENVAARLREAGAPQVRVEDGKLTDVSFFRAKTPATDSTLELLIDEHSRAPEHLTGLSLYGGEITDAGLAIIAKIPSIETLNLNQVGGGITDAGLVSLVQGLPNLRVLGLSGSSITDDGLRSIATLKHLNQLVLERTAIGNEGLAHLRNLPELEYLKLAGTQVTDDGLVHLTTLPKLKHLTLSQTDITGAGSVEHLKKLTKLEYLTVPRENFDDEHYKTLKAAAPKLWR